MSDLGPWYAAAQARRAGMRAEVYLQSAPSHTQGSEVQIMVSPEFLTATDRVLIVDGFLATGATSHAPVKIVHQAGATLVGVGAVIEKSFEGGRVRLEALGCPMRSVVAIERMPGQEIIFAA
jgi:xanthine phosphoribosyltransferase